MLNSIKSHLFKKNSAAPSKDHRPFNIDLSTRNGFESAQSLTTLSDFNRIKLYQESVSKLPMPPALWDKFQLAVKGNASSRKITAIIKSDPVLSAVVLKTVNSPAFGLVKPITELERAISHLGSNLVESIVTKHCFSGLVPQRSKTYNLEALWKHSMAVSALAKVVAPHIPDCNPSEASTIGIFHDIGRIGFNFFKGDLEGAMLDHDKGYLHFESIRFGCTHVEMGELFAKHWSLPNRIQQGIKWHHHPGGADVDSIPEDIRPEVLAVYLADLLAKHLDFAAGNNSKTLPDESYSYLIPKTTLYDIMHEKAVSKELWRVNCVDF